MGKGQKREEGEFVSPLEQLRVYTVDLVHIGEEVVVREHDTLRGPGGSGGVYECCQVLALDGIDPFVEFLCICLGCPLPQCVRQFDYTIDGFFQGVKADDFTQVREFGFNIQDLLHVLLGGNEAHLRIGIFNDIP